MNECNLNQMLSLSLSRIKHKQMADQVFISIASNRSLGLGFGHQKLRCIECQQHQEARLRVS